MSSFKTLFIILLALAEGGFSQSNDNLTDIFDIKSLLENLSINSTIIPIIRQSLTPGDFLEKPQAQRSTTNAPSLLTKELSPTAIKEDLQPEDKIGLGRKGPFNGFDKGTNFGYSFDDLGKLGYFNRPSATSNKAYQDQEDNRGSFPKHPFGNLFGLSERRQNIWRNPLHVLMQVNPLNIMNKEGMTAMEQRLLEVKRNFHRVEMERKEMFRNSDSGDMMTRFVRNLVTRGLNHYQKMTAMLEATVQSRKENILRFLRRPMVGTVLGIGEDETDQFTVESKNNREPTSGLFTPNRHRDHQHHHHGGRERQAWKLGGLFG